MLLQGYPNVQYIVMDGGSSDNSPEVIAKYAQWLDHFEIASDRGQSHAINKGLGLADGEFVGWVNSDDFYYPDTFWRLVSLAASNTSAGLFGFAVRMFWEESGASEIGLQPILTDVSTLLRNDVFLQAAGIFWRRSNGCGLLREDMHYGFDKEYWMRFLSAKREFVVENNFVAGMYRFHSTSKTCTSWQCFLRDWARAVLLHGHALHGDEALIAMHRSVFVHTSTRLAQTERSVGRSVRYLLEALTAQPRCLVQRDWLGTVRRVVGRALRGT